jgi:2-oxoglutarate ferredoxin oxidoreductase subunit delta
LLTLSPILRKLHGERYAASQGAGPGRQTWGPGTAITTKEVVFMAKLKLKELVINRDWCKGCGICIAFCPKKVLELDKLDKVVAVRPEDCICCRLCELRCPDLAIEVIEEDDHE